LNACPRPIRFLVLAACAVIAIALIACSSTDDVDSGLAGDGGPADATATSEPDGAGDGEASGSEAEIDACGVLLPEDVEAEIGVSPAPNADPVGLFQNCIYFDTATTFVQFQACRCLQGSQFDDSAKAGAEALELELTEVDDVGDKAYWYGGILWVQRGDLSFSVWISKPSYYADDGAPLEGEALDAVALPETKALAVKLLSRIE
jgi:hypothetical protein